MQLVDKLRQLVDFGVGRGTKVLQQLLERGVRRLPVETVPAKHDMVDG